MKSTIKVIAFRLPSILCPSKNNPTAVQDIMIGYARFGYLMLNNKLSKINAIPAMQMGAPMQCRMFVGTLYRFP
ncbi:MAG: hypothetical protein ACJ73C_09070 [Nitrososphaeraceae archaeon]